MSVASISFGQGISFGQSIEWGCAGFGDKVEQVITYPTPDLIYQAPGIPIYTKLLSSTITDEISLKSPITTEVILNASIC